jgi:hypothetical protein
MIPDQWVWIGVAVNLIGGAWYARIVLQAQAQPNPISWTIWSLTGWIAVGGQLAEGVGPEVLLTVTVAAIPTIIAVMSIAARWVLRNGSFAPITRLDVACGLMSILTLVVWWATASGIVAIALSIAIDAVPAVPVIRQALRMPSSDHPSIWLGGMVSAIITLLTLDNYAFVNAGFALYFLTLCTVMTILLLVVPRVRGLPAATAEQTPSASGVDANFGVGTDVACFAGAFATDYFSWDEDNPRERGAALAGYMHNVAPEQVQFLGWNGLGRQRVENVVVAAGALPTRVDGTVVTRVDVRVLYRRYHPTGAPRTTRAAVEVREDEQYARGDVPAGVPTAAAEGWVAGPARWAHVLVPVEQSSSQLTIAIDPVMRSGESEKTAPRTSLQNGVAAPQ